MVGWGAWGGHRKPWESDEGHHSGESGGHWRSPLSVAKLRQTGRASTVFVGSERDQGNHSGRAGNLMTVAFDQTLLVTAKGAVERRQCADMKQAIAVKTPDPMYPRSASQNKLMGDTTVAMTIMTDGSGSDIQLVGSATRFMDDVTCKP